MAAARKQGFDAIVVGAGVAGLGVAAILTREAGCRVLVVDRYPQFGGRLMCLADQPDRGWKVDVGLHMIELGPEGSCTLLNQRVGKKVGWGPFSRKVKIFRDGRFCNIAELVPMTDADRNEFGALLKKIAGLSEAEIESWDDRSLEEWLTQAVPNAAVRELFRDFGMIMTTIPEAADMAAGEVLWIARDNLKKVRQLLSSSYPIGGMSAITAPLAHVVRDGAGEIRLNTRVDRVLVEGGRAVGVAVEAGRHPYPSEYAIPECEEVRAERVILALPIYQLPAILEFRSPDAPLPEWWRKRILDIRHEVTGLVGYLIGLSRPVDEDLCFLSALRTRHAGLPFQGFPASNFDPSVAPPGKQLLQTDCVTEYPQVADKFSRRKILGLLWQDIREMFPDIDELVEWKLPYYVAGCDGLARKPGLVGRFKPALKAPGVANLYFAGDTYQGRGLASNGAALSAMQCADLILSEIRCKRL
ncbi:MAG: FAD-dependent oxidoreductase [bacterium]